AGHVGVGGDFFRGYRGREARESLSITRDTRQSRRPLSRSYPYGRAGCQRGDRRSQPEALGSGTGIAPCHGPTDWGGSGRGGRSVKRRHLAGVLVMVLALFVGHEAEAAEGSPTARSQMLRL